MNKMLKISFWQLIKMQQNDIILAIAFCCILAIATKYLNFVHFNQLSIATMHQNKQNMYKGIWEDSRKLRDNTINKLITIRFVN